MAIRIREAVAPRTSPDRLRRWLARWCRTAVNLIFPPRCAYCDLDLGEPHDALLLCQACREKLGPEQWPCCRRCGAAIPADCPPPERCGLCRSARLHFDTVVPLAEYQEDLRSAILRMKRPPGESLSKAMGQLLARRRGQRLAELEPDVIAPIPMHWARRLKRGTNSPEILAGCLAQRLGVPLEAHLLVRRRNTKPQPGLRPPQRFANLKGAFRTSKGYDFRGVRVLLVDDVLTTGATCSEAAHVLKQAGAAWVAAAVLARAEGDK